MFMTGTTYHPVQNIAGEEIRLTNEQYENLMKRHIKRIPFGFLPGMRNFWDIKDVTIGNFSKREDHMYEFGVYGKDDLMVLIVDCYPIEVDYLKARVGRRLNFSVMRTGTDYRDHYILFANNLA